MTRNKLLLILAALALVVGIALLVPSTHPRSLKTTTGEVTSSPVVPPASSASSVPLDSLSSRVVQFETAYRGFDWSSPEAREQKLTGYFLPETLSSVKQVEQGSVRQAMVESHTTQIVTSVGILTGEVDGDLAETTAIVTIRKTQPGSDPFEYTIESKTSWVSTGNVWLVYTIDPL